MTRTNPALAKSRAAHAAQMGEAAVHGELIAALFRMNPAALAQLPAILADIERRAGPGTSYGEIPGFFEGIQRAANSMRNMTGVG